MAEPNTPPEPAARPLRVVLASSSPSRRALLEAAGIAVEVRPPQVDEEACTADLLAADPGTDAGALTVHLARTKLADALDRHRLDGLAGGDPPTGRIVIAADSVFTCAGQQMGKPATRTEARQRWQQMRGETGVLTTGHALCLLNCDGVDPLEVHAWATASEVDIAAVGDGELEAYLDSAEPYGAAGGFTLEGRAAAFITAIRGSVSNVQGLSLPDLRTVLAGLHVPWPALWSPYTRPTDRPQPAEVT